MSLTRDYVWGWGTLSFSWFVSAGSVPLVGLLVFLLVGSAWSWCEMVGVCDEPIFYTLSVCRCPVVTRPFNMFLSFCPCRICLLSYYLSFFCSWCHETYIGAGDYGSFAWWNTVCVWSDAFKALFLVYLFIEYFILVVQTSYLFIEQKFEMCFMHTKGLMHNIALI